MGPAADAIHGEGYAASAPVRIAKWLSITLAGAIGVYAVSALTGGTYTTWFVISTAAWTALLAAAVLWLTKGGVVAGAAVALAGTTVSRLLSTVRSESDFKPGSSASDILLQVETGRGVPGFQALGLALIVALSAYFGLIAAQDARLSLARSREQAVTWVWTFLRVYLGVMFVPHYAGHVLAGPHYFAIYTEYFQSLGLPFPSAQLGLAGAVEIAVAVGLTLGFLTRLAALVGAVYLFLTMLLGGHFPIGYVWILPNGGWEFGVFWAAAVALHAFTGAVGPSVDEVIRPRIARWPALARLLVG